MDINYLDEFLERACERNLLASVHRLSPEALKEEWARNRGIVSALQGQTDILGQPVLVRVGLDKYFPLSLPVIFLTPWNALGFIPHVDRDGYVCFAEEEGLLINRRNPSGVIEEALQRAKKVLADGVKQSNHKDFSDEYESYWIRLKEVERVGSFIRPNDAVRKIVIAVSNKGYEFVCDGEAAVIEYLNGKNPKHYTIRSGLYIPLRTDLPIAPPSGDAVWDIEKVREVVDTGVTPKNLKALEKLSRKWKYEELVVFMLPRPSGGATLFGIRFKRVSGGHPLRKEGRAGSLIPVAFVRHDRDYLVPRGGGKMTLENKNIALVGCGSVGGYIALEIARTGITGLTLVDHDTLSQENTFRHVLGKSAIGKLKVEALKKEIEEKIPYIKVTPIDKHIETAISDGLLDLHRFDLLIVALGKPTIELYLNETLHRLKGSLPAVFTWLEPYGIGGHAILANNFQEGRQVPGCLECLFTPTAGDSDSSLYNRSSFAKEGQSFGKNISGCAGLFTPYGSLDAMRTAELATRLAVQVLEGTVFGNPILSWKGTATEFVQAGFSFSSRYGLSEEELHEKRYEYIRCECPVCGKAVVNGG